MNAYRHIASCLGVGYTPKAPGTAASALAALVGAALLHWVGPLPVVLLSAALFALGWKAVASVLTPADTDPSWVVVDEVAAQLLVVALSPFAEYPLINAVAALASFRLFDIAKPWPVSAADALHSPLGVMLDDLLAALLALLLLVLCSAFAT
jgi:phosphatidylglycerophosphatase A